MNSGRGEGDIWLRIEKEEIAHEKDKAVEIPWIDTICSLLNSNAEVSLEL